MKVVRPKNRRPQEIEEEHDGDRLLDREKETQEGYGNEPGAESDRGPHVEGHEDDDHGAGEKEGMVQEIPGDERDRDGRTLAETGRGADVTA